ncbi:MAG TPA: class I SAM-dependent RNA methyltransferase [Ktedonobacterales bacterium]|nr:class I SAM-dependent RNA methyltransferase [Ktedonobacterales bacterium]
MTFQGGEEQSGNRAQRGSADAPAAHASDDQAIEHTAAGEIVDLELVDLAYGGDAVGRFDGRAIFVTGGLPGELVRARLTRERSNYARATLVEVLRPSPDRVEARYPALTDSGGFQWQHLAYPAQVAWKTRIVRQLLMRVGRFANPPVLPTLGMPPGADLWRYRTVAQFAVGPQGEIGFRRMESHDVLDMPDCPIVHPALDRLYQDVRGWMRANWGADASAFVERFTLRVAAPPATSGGSATGGSATGAATGQGDAATPTPGAFGDSGVFRLPGVPLRPGVPQRRASDVWDAYRADVEGLLTLEARPGSAFDAAGGPEGIARALLAAAPKLVGVVILGLPGGRGRIVVGQDFVHERVRQRLFRISAGSFFQVNAAQTPVLVERALSALRPQPGDWALDGYSGVGLFSLFLADYVAHVHAVESQPSAVADARASATLNNVGNIAVSEGVIERVLGSLQRQRTRVDIALVDPPRSGCHPRALAELKALGPRTLVYVSCDPSTLARDLRYLCEDGAYRLVSVQPVDMFPFTAHIECVAICDRVRKPR